MWTIVEIVRVSNLHKPSRLEAHKYPIRWSHRRYVPSRGSVLMFCFFFGGDGFFEIPQQYPWYYPYQLKFAYLAKLWANIQPRRNLRFYFFLFCWKGLIPYFGVLETTRVIFSVEWLYFCPKLPKNEFFGNFSIWTEKRNTALQVNKKHSKMPWIEKFQFFSKTPKGSRLLDKKVWSNPTHSTL